LWCTLVWFGLFWLIETKYVQSFDREISKKATHVNARGRRRSLTLDCILHFDSKDHIYTIRPRTFSQAVTLLLRILKGPFRILAVPPTVLTEGCRLFSFSSWIPGHNVDLEHHRFLPCHFGFSTAFLSVIWYCVLWVAECLVKLCVRIQISYTTIPPNTHVV
jgi:hypothetical protein